MSFYKNLINVIESLQGKRPIFHSEADFQFSLAWEIKLLYKDKAYEVYLEKPLRNANKEPEKDKNSNNSYLDIFVQENGNKIGIELKYLTAELAVMQILCKEKF